MELVALGGLIRECVGSGWVIPIFGWGTPVHGGSRQWDPCGGGGPHARVGRCLVIPVWGLGGCTHAGRKHGWEVVCVGVG